MSYSTAYTASFTSHGGVAWRIEIGLPGHTGQPSVISLDYDEPVTIEWKEIEPHEAVQSSVCTLKVVNERDRQMAALMQGDALCSVYRENTLYWRGLLDDSVYEEPYSFDDGYVTELTFSDFGILNRREYKPNGIMTLYDIVRGLAEQAELPLTSFTQVIPLYTADNTHVTLGSLSVNTERFRGMKQMEVLDGILRSLNLHIIQAGGILVYDTMGISGNILFPSLPVAWKGTDARMRGGKTYGWYELSFAHDAKPEIADGELDPEKSGWDTTNRYWVKYFGDEQNPPRPGFYIYWSKYYGSPSQTILRLAPNTPARFFLTRSAYDNSDSVFVALRAGYIDSESDYYSWKWFRPQGMKHVWQEASELMSLSSRNLPDPPSSYDFEIRVNLDLLLSPKFNPLEEEENGNYWNDAEAAEMTWEKWKKNIKTVHVPVKLELLDESGNAVMHYRNATIPDPNSANLLPIAHPPGIWEQGPAAWSDMVLSYYKDGKEDTAMDGWATNRQSISESLTEPSGLFKERKDGEYVPIPPYPGRLRLTVSDVITGGDDDTKPWLGRFDGLYVWQAYRNPKLTIVRRNRVDDGVATDDFEVKEVPGHLLESFSESFPVGSHEKGLSSASLGLLLDGNMAAVGKLVKNGVADTLVRHRLHSLEDQYLGVHAVLSGTAEIGTTILCSDASTPGEFLVTARRQDLLMDTEEVTMVMVHPMSDHYAIAWSNPVCAIGEEGYRHEWSNPVCAAIPPGYGFAWSNPICARNLVTLPPVWQELTGV